MNFAQTGYKGKNDWWMYFIVFVIVFIVNIFSQIPLTLVAFAKAGWDPDVIAASAKNNLADLGIDPNLYLFLILITFAIPFFFFYLALKGIHKKKLTWIITAREKIDWGRVRYGAVVWGIITIIFIGIGIFLAPENYVWNFKPVPFFTLCFVAILFIPIQTTFEEVLFRGYYYQGLALWIKNKWAPMLIMGIVFGGLHGMNPEIDKLGYTALIFYIGTGIFFGITTLLDDGAELAIGMHAINNILAALFVTTDWTVFQTDALFVDTSEPSLGVEMFLPVFVLYPIVILIFSKKYGWTNWKDKIFGEVHKPIQTDTIEEIGA